MRYYCHSSTRVCIFQLFLKQEKSIRKVTEKLFHFWNICTSQIVQQLLRKWVHHVSRMSFPEQWRKEKEKKNWLRRSQGKGKVEPLHNRSAYFILSVLFMASFHYLPKCDGTDFCPCIPTEPTEMSNCTSKTLSPILKSKGNSRVTEVARGTSIIKQFTLKAAYNLSSISFSGLTPLVVYYSQRK